MAGKEHPGIIYTKNFRYPPVLPIIFYDGPEPWSAARTLAERTELGGIFSRFIPGFVYALVSLRDYPFDVLTREADPLSFVLMTRYGAAREVRCWGNCLKNTSNSNFKITTDGHGQTRMN